MVKRLLASTLLFFAAFCAAQTTTTFTGTVTDPDGQTWSNANWTVTLFNPYGTTPVNTCGGSSATQFNGQLDSTGAFAGSGNTAIPRTSCISPGGTSWKFSIQPHASVAPYAYVQPLSLTTATFNLGTPLSVVITAPRFAADMCPSKVCTNGPTTSNAFGYRDAETQLGTFDTPGTYYNVTLECQRWWNTTTSTWYCGTATNPSATIQVNGVNLLGSPPNFEDDGSVSFTNPSGGKIHATAGSTGAVSYLPATTNFIFASYSGLYDDGHGLSSAVPVADFTCTGTTCTVDTSTPHGLTTTGTDSYVDVTTMTGFGATQQTPGNGSFIVASTPTSTQFTFASSTVATCASSCGNIYDAGYWGLYQTAQQPFIKNSHGTVYGIESYASNLDTNFATLVAPMCALPGPNILLLFLGQNDIVSGGDSYLTVEGHLQSIWSKANAAGCQVVQATYTNVNAGFLTAAQYLAFSQLNAWIPQQSKSFANTASGQYWSKMIDYGSYIYDSHLMVLSDTNGAYQFAQRTNSAFATQSSSVTGPSPNFFWFSGQLGFNLFQNEALYWFDNSQNAFLQFNSQQDSIQIQSLNGNGWSPLVVTDSGGNYICDATMGHDWDFFGATNNSMCFAFHYFGDGSTSNYMSFIPHGGGSGDLIRFGVDYSVTMPGFGGGGNQTLGVDNNGKFILGVGATAPAWTSASSGLASGNWSSSSCTVGGVAKTCIEEDIDTGALTNGATTTVPLISTITGGVFSVVCSDNSGRVQTGNTQPVGANFVGLSAPYATFFVWTGASGENAYCVVKGYN